MGLFNNFFGNQKESHAKLILLAGVTSSKIMFEKNQISKSAVFEVLLFSSLHILRTYQQKRPQQYSNFEADYFIELYKFAKNEGLLDKIPGDFTEFVNNRFQLYGQQLNLMENDSEGTFIPAKIAFNFYITPLLLNSGDNIDLYAIMIMTMKIKQLFRALEDSIDIVLKEQ